MWSELGKRHLGFAAPFDLDELEKSWILVTWSQWRLDDMEADTF